MWNASFRYKGVQVNLFGVWCPNIKNKRSIYGAINRLNQNGLIEKKGDLWFITKKGEFYLTEYKKYKQFESILKAPFKEKMILMFDIPEKNKRERQWLRMHLKRFHFQLVQKSVWLGPRPLPNGFDGYLRQIGIREYIKTYNISSK